MDSVNRTGTDRENRGRSGTIPDPMPGLIKHAAMTLKIIDQRGFHESAVMQQMVAEDLNALTEALRENARR